MGALADSNRTSGTRLQALEDAAHAHGIELSVHYITRPDDIPAAVDAAKASGAAALNVLASPVLYSGRRIVMQSVAAVRLPAIYQFPEQAEEGAFVAYGPRLVDIFRELMAPQLVKLLRGTRPADIPIEQPTKFELVINLKTANALGVDGARDVGGTRRQSDRISAPAASWCDPAGGSPAQVRGSARLVASVAWPLATAVAKRTQQLHGVWD